MIKVYETDAHLSGNKNTLSTPYYERNIKRLFEVKIVCFCCTTNKPIILQQLLRRVYCHSADGAKQL